MTVAVGCKMLPEIFKTPCWQPTKKKEKTNKQQEQQEKNENNAKSQVLVVA